MALSVDPPSPPELEPIDPAEYEDVETVADSNYRREELQDLLEDGAWEEAFETWAADSDMDPESFAIATDLGLFERFDFFWDDFADRVGYHAPGIPEDWKEREIHPEITSWSTVSEINAGLTELGQITCEVLKAEYIDWEADYEPPDDLPDL
jgi:hypothetical protein